MVTYYTLVYPYVTCGNITWADTYKINLAKLQRLQSIVSKVAGFEYMPTFFSSVAIT